MQPSTDAAFRRRFEYFIADIQIINLLVEVIEYETSK